jgi:RNA polymerase sigma-70 factor (ECF subfamily)
MHIRRLVIDHSDTDDVIQNTFIKVWDHIDTFREDSQLFTWIYRIATNESLSFLKKKKIRHFIPFTNIAYKLANTLKEDPYYEGDAIQKKLYEAILQLPKKQKLVFNMKYFDKLKYEEISKILGTSVGALKTSYHLAVKKIKNHIDKN